MKAFLFSFIFFIPFVYASECIHPQVKPWDQIEALTKFVEQVTVDLDRCAYANPKRKPKHIINLFEGRAGFSKKLLVDFKKFQALNPKCSKNAEGKFIYTFPSGKWMYADNLKGQLDQVVNPETSGTAVGLKNFIIEGFCKTGLDFSETEVFLWGQEEGVKEAVTCAKKNFWNRYDNVHTPSMLVMGYSRGGARAIEFANKISREGIKIDQGLTIDPVPTALLPTIAKIPAAFAGLPLKSHVPNSFVIPKDVPWVNYWQESDNRWNKLDFLGSAGLHGSPVKGATLNKEIYPPVPQTKKNGGHWRIFFDQEVQDTISTVLKKTNS